MVARLLDAGECGADPLGHINSLPVDRPPVVQYSLTLSASDNRACMFPLAKRQGVQTKRLVCRRPAQAWALQPVTSPQPVRVSNRAQQMFLEYAHFIPERGTDVVVEHMRMALARVIGGTDLKERLDTPAVLQIFSDAYRGGSGARAIVMEA